MRLNPFLFDDLRARGLVSQSTPDLAEHLASAQRTVYCGFDPTADSLHIGSLVPLWHCADFNSQDTFRLRWWVGQRASSATPVSRHRNAA